MSYSWTYVKRTVNEVSDRAKLLILCHHLRLSHSKSLVFLYSRFAYVFVYILTESEIGPNSPIEFGLCFGVFFFFFVNGFHLLHNMEPTQNETKCYYTDSWRAVNSFFSFNIWQVLRSMRWSCCVKSWLRILWMIQNQKFNDKRMNWKMNKQLQELLLNTLLMNIFCNWSPW